MPEVPAAELVPDALRRTRPARLPEVSELDLVRHFTRLSHAELRRRQRLLPARLVHDEVQPARSTRRRRASPGFAGLHPYQPESTRAGRARAACTSSSSCAGRDRRPGRRHAAAGGRRPRRAHRPADHPRGLPRAEGRAPTQVLIPDSAHGTNPASVVDGGLRAASPSRATRAAASTSTRCARLVDDDVAGLMLTNPNTLGLFDENIAEIAELVHEAGGLLYYDGANLNAILGISRARRHGLRRHALQPAQDVHARRTAAAGPAPGPIVRAATPRAVPAGAAGRDGRRTVAFCLGLRPPAVDRQGAHLLRQLRRAGPRLRLHPQPGRRGPAPRSARRRCSTPTT